MTTEPAHALLFPYLWIRDRLQVGPYELVSKNVVTADDYAQPWIERDVTGLLEMYEMRGSMSDRFGTLVRRLDSKIGDRFERSEMKPLHRAVTAALLDRIPLEIGKKEDTQGWHVVTSDNALVYLHHLDGSGHVAVHYGRMVETLVGGLTIGEEHNPTGAWVAQQARNLSFTSLFRRMRFLIHDRDSKFTASVDEVFRSEGIEVIHTPLRAPQANPFAERFVRTVRTECLDGS